MIQHIRIFYYNNMTRQPEGEVARQPEGEVAQQAKFFQPAQPTPNPIRDRSVRPDDMQDGRNTSRPQEINVNSFNEGLSSSDKTGRPVVSEDKMSLNVEQTHDRMGRLLLFFIQLQHKTTLKYLMKSILSTLMMKYFVKRMEKSIAVHDENHEPIMVNEADMDFRIPGQPHSVVKNAQRTSVRQLIQKIENHPVRHALQKDLQ